MNYKCIAVDVATYTKLKNMAKNDGRTMGGEIRFLMNLAGNNAVAQAGPTIDLGYVQATEPSVDLLANHKSEKQIKLEQMVNRLKYFEEGSPEYEEVLSKISELQENA